MRLGLYLGFSNKRNFGDWWLYETIKASVSGARVFPLQRRVPPRARRILYDRWQAGRGPRPNTVMIGGGTILAPGSQDILQAARQLRESRLFSVGTGAKSLEELERFSLMNPDRRARLQAIASSASALTVRGPVSAATVLDLTGVRPMIVGDAFLGLFDGQTRPHSEGTDRTVLLNVADLHESQSHHWELPGGSEAFYDRLIGGLARAGHPVTVYCVALEDVPLARRLCHRHSASPPKLALSPDQLSALFEEHALHVATRLHAAIYGIIRGKPTAVISYQDKHLDFLQSLAFPMGVQRASELTGDLVEHCQVMWTALAPHWPIISQRVDDLNRLRQQLYMDIGGSIRE